MAQLNTADERTVLASAALRLEQALRPTGRPRFMCSGHPVAMKDIQPQGYCCTSLFDVAAPEVSSVPKAGMGAAATGWLASGPL
jgi:hypothetical protein